MITYYSLFSFQPEPVRRGEPEGEAGRVRHQTDRRDGDLREQGGSRGQAQGVQPADSGES